MELVIWLHIIRKLSDLPEPAHQARPAHPSPRTVITIHRRAGRKCALSSREERRLFFPPSSGLLSKNICAGEEKVARESSEALKDNHLDRRDVNMLPQNA